MKKNRRLKIASLVLAIGSAIVITAYIILAILNVFDRTVITDIVFAVLTPTFLVCLALTFAAYRANTVAVHQLERENEYNLGMPNHFYNSYFFELEVQRLLRKRAYRGLTPRLIGFTFSNNTVSKNSSRNEFIVSFLGHISRYLTIEFGPENINYPYPFSFCYYHGVFLLFMFGNEHDIETIINRIENAMYKIADDNQLNIYVQPFFGIATINREETTLVKAIDHALFARTRAEKRYETSYYYDESASNNNVTTDIEEIKQALKDNEFVVYYQPKFSLTTQRFNSTEALVRWNSPKYGLLPPSKFIDAAENSGLIHLIDDYVLERVCMDIRENKAKGRRNLPVSVNFSMQEFYDTNFIDETIEICRKYKVPTDMIQIEITESTSQTNQFMSTSIIEKLKGLGFRILMDDFGTGFSNIENLMLLPFDAVKLDRSYIERIVSDNKSRELVKFLILLCKNNKMEVIAEGVDAEQQVNILKRLGCDTIQGYYYSKPIPKDVLDKMILPGGNPFEKPLKKGAQE